MEIQNIKLFFFFAFLIAICAICFLFFCYWCVRDSGFPEKTSKPIIVLVELGTIISLILFCASGFHTFLSFLPYRIEQGINTLLTCTATGAFYNFLVCYAKMKKRVRELERLRFKDS